MNMNYALRNDEFISEIYNRLSNMGHYFDISEGDSIMEQIICQIPAIADEMIKGILGNVVESKEYFLREYPEIAQEIENWLSAMAWYLENIDDCEAVISYDNSLPELDDLCLDIMELTDYKSGLLSSDSSLLDEIMDDILDGHNIDPEYYRAFIEVQGEWCCTIARFQEMFRGVYLSEIDFCKYWLSDTGYFSECCEEMERFFDFEKYWHSEMRDDFTYHTESGCIFLNC